jgi:hypothetical protein
MFHIPLEVSTVLGSAPRTRWELARRWGLLSGVADLNPNQTIERIRAFRQCVGVQRWGTCNGSGLSSVGDCVGGSVRRMLEGTAVKCTVMPKDVIVVRHPEFARLQHQIAIATERFNQATKEKQGSLDFIGSQLTITLEDRKAFLDQLRTEQEAYDVIQELHEKIIHLLREKNQAKAATTDRR